MITECRKTAFVRKKYLRQETYLDIMRHRTQRLFRIASQSRYACHKRTQISRKRYFEINTIANAISVAKLRTTIATTNLGRIAPSIRNLRNSRQALPD